MRETLSEREAAEGRSRLAAFGGNVLWQVVGVAAGAISYAAEAGGSSWRCAEPPCAASSGAADATFRLAASTTPHWGD